MSLAFPRLYAIMDAILLPTSELAFAEMMAESGVEVIQYRNKEAASRRLFEVSELLAQALKSRRIRFLVNDRPDIARLADAGGVHVGQEDLGVEDARAVCGPDRWVGVSTHTLEQVQRAENTSADYIAVGPIVATSTKQKPDAVVGTEFIRRARRITRKPLVAIGGITAERATEAYRAGADCVAVASDLVRPGDLAARVREYLEAARSARGATHDVSGNAGGPSMALGE